MRVADQKGTKDLAQSAEKIAEEIETNELRELSEEEIASVAAAGEMTTASEINES